MVIPRETPRIFLTVMDDSEEAKIALHYAIARAAATDGRVAVLYAIEPHEIFLWRMVEQSIDKGQEQEALNALREHEQTIETMTGHKPIFYIRHGKRREVLLQLLEQEQSISLLVLAAGSSKGGPGPLIHYLTTAKGMERLKIPFVVVPKGYMGKIET